MFKGLTALKSALMGLVLIGSLAAAAPAGAYAPELHNNGSNFYSVNIYGAYFTPNSVVHVIVLDPYRGSMYASGYVVTSDKICLWIYCYGGGAFDYSAAVSVVCPLTYRQAYAYDVNSGWIGPLNLSCA
jgi:hypothetical protein